MWSKDNQSWRWPTWRIGRKRKRFAWFSAYCVQYFAALYIEKTRWCGYVGPLSFWLDKRHVTLIIGPYMLCWHFRSRPRLTKEEW